MATMLFAADDYRVSNDGDANNIYIYIYIYIYDQGDDVLEPKDCLWIEPSRANFWKAPEDVALC